jgi:hypothetical protein
MKCQVTGIYGAFSYCAGRAGGSGSGITGAGIPSIPRRRTPSPIRQSALSAVVEEQALHDAHEQIGRVTDIDAQQDCPFHTIDPAWAPEAITDEEEGKGQGAHNRHVP